jgi:tetratricopeptide (TPR) repeat protein
MIDPTYLRSINDGLVSGAIHKGNASALPDGLVGMYEEALPASVNVNERKKFLEFFSIWALLKKEVSAEFVAPLLAGWTEEQVMDCIARYSKWFNSPVSGKYVLYHERLRTFVLQKVSHHHFEKCNEQIIHQCQLALQVKAVDEWELYALEYLSTHLLIQAMKSKDSEALKALSYNTTHWNRQIEISKGFEWSKRMLNDMMLWASKYVDDEVIECALNKVDLHHLEQNDAPRIVELVAQNDIETALQRIESFGGNDKEGLQRKFILYMLCLMELTLLDSKDKPFRKEAIEKLLKHLDDNLPVDHSVLNWNEFFPSYLMFQMACELADLELNYPLLLMRTEDLYTGWIKDHSTYSGEQVEVLDKCIGSIKNEYRRNIALIDFSEKLAKCGSIKEAINCVKVISHELDKIKALGGISHQLFLQGSLEQCSCVMQESLELARGISIHSIKMNGLKYVSSELTKQGKVEEGAFLMQESFECALSICDNYEKHIALQDICCEWARQGKLDEALNCAKGITDEYLRRATYASISTEMSNQGHYENAKQTMKSAIIFNEPIKDEDWKSNVLSTCSRHLARQGRILDAIECSRGISDLSYLNSVVEDIAYEFSKRGKFEEALECALGITDVNHYWPCLGSIAKELVKQGQIPKALTCVEEIQNIYRKNVVLKDISAELARKGDLEEAIEITLRITDGNCYLQAASNIAAELTIKGLLNEAATILLNNLSHISVINNESNKNKTLRFVAESLLKNNQFQLALKCTQNILDVSDRSNALNDICEELTKQCNFKEALFCARDIIDENWKFRALKFVSAELVRTTLQSEVTSLMDVVLDCAREIKDERIRCILFAAISSKYEKLGISDKSESTLQESLSCVANMSDFLRITTLPVIASELVMQGKLKEALSLADDLDLEVWKSRVHASISIQLSHLSKLELALCFARGINDDWWRGFALQTISGVLANNGMIEEAKFTIEESFMCFLSINHEETKSRALKDLSGELAQILDVKKTLECTKAISVDSELRGAYMAIAISLAKKGALTHAEQVASQITNISDRHNCWQQMAQALFSKLGYLNAMAQLVHFTQSESRHHLQRGIAQALDVSTITPGLARNALLQPGQELAVQKNLLREISLNQLFFSQLSSKQKHRLNRTLNIQWAIDIKNSFHEN